jgi:hypothetical protein
MIKRNVARQEVKCEMGILASEADEIVGMWLRDVGDAGM